jgi:hypothetical protein
MKTTEAVRVLERCLLNLQKMRRCGPYPDIENEIKNLQSRLLAMPKKEVIFYGETTH